MNRHRRQPAQAVVTEPEEAVEEDSGAEDVEDIEEPQGAAEDAEPEGEEPEAQADPEAA